MIKKIQYEVNNFEVKLAFGQEKQPKTQYSTSFDIRDEKKGSSSYRIGDQSNLTGRPTLILT
jgi:hypothetical protein